MKIITSILFLSILAISCTAPKQNIDQSAELEKLQAELTSFRKAQKESLTNTQGQIATFLTFQKEDAEEAMNFYMKLFDNSKIVDIKRWGEGAPSKEGTIMHATFTLKGKLFMCSDSPPIHAWDFSPAVSNFVECVDANELNRLFTALSENGQVMMPLNNYGFSQKFGWVQDKFGVSWQLNLK